MSNILQKINRPFVSTLLRSPYKAIGTNRASLHVVTKNVEDVFTMYTVSPSIYWADRHDHPGKPLPESLHLIDKNIKDSYVERSLPFKSNPRFLDNYISTDGKIRVGKILEALDKTAGAVSLKHMEGATPISIVTASFRNFHLFLPNVGDKDCVIRGRINYAGKSSMEISIKAETVPDKQTVLTATAVMVGVEPENHKPLRVNPLLPTTPGEHALIESRKEAILGKKKQEMSPEAYDKEYHRLLDSTHARGHVKTMFMDETSMHSHFSTLPQDRNLNNKVFGGYLMRRAYELAHASTSVLLKSYPTFVSMEDALFLKPVPIGAVVNMKSTIVTSETHPNRILQIRVVAESTHVDTGVREMSNVFHFTVAAEEGAQIPIIVPKTAEERKIWVDAHHRREKSLHERDQKQLF